MYSKVKPGEFESRGIPPGMASRIPLEVVSPLPTNAGRTRSAVCQEEDVLDYSRFHFLVSGDMGFQHAHFKVGKGIGRRMSKGASTAREGTVRRLWYLAARWIGERTTLTFSGWSSGQCPVTRQELFVPHVELFVRRAWSNQCGATPGPCRAGGQGREGLRPLRPSELAARHHQQNKRAAGSQPGQPSRRDRDASSARVPIRRRGRTAQRRSPVPVQMWQG